LLGQVSLDSLQIQKFWAKLEGHWKSFVKFLIVSLQLLSVLSLKLTKSLSILLLCLEKIIVPLLVKLVILLNMCLLALFPLLGLVKQEFIAFSLIILIL
jgi:hypothetical protein